MQNVKPSCHSEKSIWNIALIMKSRFYWKHSPDSEHSLSLCVTYTFLFCDWILASRATFFHPSVSSLDKKTGIGKKRGRPADLARTPSCFSFAFHFISVTKKPYNNSEKLVLLSQFLVWYVQDINWNPQPWAMPQTSRNSQSLWLKCTEFQKSDSTIKDRLQESWHFPESLVKILR